MAKKPTTYTVTDGKLVLTLEVVEEGGYFVTSPFNPDIKTQADTLEEAFEMARDVIALFEDVRAEERKATGRGKKAAAPGGKRQVG
jgi:predicted RNase H-like HicB family nuclease